jgi:hypothetical protein
MSSSSKGIAERYATNDADPDPITGSQPGPRHEHLYVYLRRVTGEGDPEASAEQLARLGNLEQTVNILSRGIAESEEARPGSAEEASRYTPSGPAHSMCALGATSAKQDAVLCWGDQKGLDVTKDLVYETRVQLSVTPSASGVQAVWDVASDWVDGPDNKAQTQHYIRVTRCKVAVEC